MAEPCTVRQHQIGNAVVAVPIRLPPKRRRAAATAAAVSLTTTTRRFVEVVKRCQLESTFTLLEVDLRR